MAIQIAAVACMHGARSMTLRHVRQTRSCRLLRMLSKYVCCWLIFTDYQPNECCLVVYEEGSTNGVLLSHDNLTWTASQLSCGSGFDGKDVFLSLCPLEQMKSLVCVLIWFVTDLDSLSALWLRWLWLVARGTLPGTTKYVQIVVFGLLPFRYLELCRCCERFDRLFSLLMPGSGRT